MKNSSPSRMMSDCWGKASSKDKKKGPEKKGSEKKGKNNKKPKSKKEVVSDENDSANESESDETSDKGEKVAEENDEDRDEESDYDSKKKSKNASKAKKTPAKTPKKKTEKKEKVKKEDKKGSSKGTKRKRVDDDTDESSDEKPNAKKAKMPTDDEIKQLVKRILDSANLQEITMKKVIKQVAEAYPDCDLSHKKAFIKTTIKSNKIRRKVKAFQNKLWEDNLRSLEPDDSSLWEMLKELREKKSPVYALSGQAGIAHTDFDKAVVLACSLETQFQENNISSSSDYLINRAVENYFLNENNFDAPYPLPCLRRFLISLRTQKLNALRAERESLTKYIIT
ncbi:protein DEK [Trichonephila clavipes]|nr:protein DEK [Trichonephila clavipes]